MAKAHQGVTPLGQGRYRVRTQVTHPKTGRRHEIDRQVEARSARDAARVLARLRADWLSSRGRAAAGGPARLRDALGAWYEEKKATIKPSTASTYGLAVERLTAVLGDYLVSELEPRDVRSMLLGSREGGYSHDYVSGWLRVLRTWAAETGNRHVTDGIRFVRPVEDEERVEDEGRGLSLDELRRFLEAGPELRTTKRGEVTLPWRRAWALVCTMAWTGLRFGEASALEWRDVDLAEGTIRVRRAQWRGIKGHVKARASKRTLVVPVDVVEVLREHRRALVAHQQTGCGSPLVFPSRRKGATYVSNIYPRKAVLAVCKAAGIDLDGRPAVHVTRHTFNNLLRQQASEIVRQSLVGHADEEVGKRYSAATMDEKRAAVGGVVRMVRGEEER